MKHPARILFLIILAPIRILAQYGGGDGRGEINANTGNNQLSGITLDLYGGGNGRGENITNFSAGQLNGITLNLYAGGNGRGEYTSNTINNQLNGITLNLYSGGNGRGESNTIIADNQLNGAMLNIFGGGDGRGEYSSNSSNNQLSGIILNLYGGGDGRGEGVLGNNTLQLDGTTAATMFLGGSGRGEGAQQRNTTPLPVKLMSFGASLAGQTVLVQWQTASEQNSDYFIVERSIDGIGWQSIGQVPAAGHSDLPLTYQLTDPHPVEGLNYYRLKPTDLDGKFTLSTVATVYFHTAAPSGISVYPNPVKYQFTLALKNTSATSPYHCTLVTAQGQIILTRPNLQGPTQTFDMSRLAAGIYFLVVDQDGKVSTVKVVKE